MVTKQITRDELSSLENKIKLDIGKEQTEYRHQQNANIQKYMILVDELKTDLALNSQIQESMLEQLKEMKADLKKHFEDEEKYHKELMEKLDNKYSGKWVEKFITWALYLCGAAGLGAILKLIIR